jgi:chemotaxis protein histidine kinase CheA
MTTEIKSFKMITFRRHITKSYFETAEMTYGEFASYIRKNGMGGKKITDDEIIKKMWDELANSGEDEGDGVAVVDTEQEKEYDDVDDECWDDDDELWDYIADFDFEDCFPEPEDTRTPEQKAEDEKKKAEKEAKEKEFFEKRAAEQKKHAEAYAEKQKAERIANAPKNILNVISLAAELYQHPPSPPNEEDEQWKIKVMRTVARQRILGKMKELVAELEEVAKW